MSPSHAHFRHGALANLSGLLLGVAAYYLVFMVTGSSHLLLAIGIGVVTVVLTWVLLARGRSFRDQE